MPIDVSSEQIMIYIISVRVRVTFRNGDIPLRGGGENGIMRHEFGRETGVETEH